MSKKTFIGQLVSAKMKDTVIVVVDVPKKHKIYGKKLKSTKRFMSKNPIGAQIGDTVIIEEAVPTSKHCAWVITTKLEEGAK